MPNETQSTIGQWARDTFPGGDDLSPRHCIRLLEEVCELCLAAGAQPADLYRVCSADRPNGQAWFESRPESPERVARELADVAIVIAVIAERRGVDLAAEVDAKMALNRRRVWRSNGDGTGYHVRVGSF